MGAGIGLFYLAQEKWDWGLLTGTGIWPLGMGNEVLKKWEWD